MEMRSNTTTILIVVSTLALVFAESFGQASVYNKVRERERETQLLRSVIRMIRSYSVNKGPKDVIKHVTEYRMIVYKPFQVLFKYSWSTYYCFDFGRKRTLPLIMCSYAENAVEETATRQEVIVEMEAAATAT